MKKEIRTFEAQDMEIRTEEDNAPVVRGYAAVFDKLSVDMGFREKIAPGAFAKSIEKNNIKALWNHNTDFPLANTKAGTLTLKEDSKGLRFELELPDSTWGKDAEIAIRRGDCDGVSFGFRVNVDEWENSNQEKPVRTLRDVELFEISPTPFPAYPQTSLNVRSADEVFEDYQAAQAAEDREAAESQKAIAAEQRESQKVSHELELIEIKNQRRGEGK